MIYFTYILYLLTSFTLCFTCRRSTHPIEPYHIKLVENHVYAPFDDCNFVINNPKLVINPYKKEIENLVHRKPFGSFCLKCAACLAIADEIVRTIKDAIDSIEPDEISIEKINRQLAHDLNVLSAKGFKNYGLKKYKDDSLITNKLDCTEHIISNMDGSWTKKLREICKLYISYMDLDNILNDFVDDIDALPQTLCSGTGIFRDCVNVDSDKYSKMLNSLQNCDHCTCSSNKMYGM